MNESAKVKRLKDVELIIRIGKYYLYDRDTKRIWHACKHSYQNTLVDQIRFMITTIPEAPSGIFLVTGIFIMALILAIRCYGLEC